MNSTFAKKLKHYDSLIITILVIIVSIVLVAFVYGKMYRLTEYNSWLRLSSVAEEVGSNFSNNLQYQSLYLSDYAQIIRENKLNTKEELEDFARKLLLNAGVYEVYVLLPDNRVLGEKGKLIYNESPGAFGKISKKGEHYSDILHNYENPSSFLINHYYPVDVDGKIVCVLFCPIDLDFLSNEGIVTIYDGNADYIIFNSRTHEMYVNTYTKLMGNISTFLMRILPAKNQIDAFIAACELREKSTLELGSDSAKMFFYAMPIASDEFSLCVFSRWNVLFSDLRLFKSVSSKIILIMTIVYIIYLFYIIKSNRDKLNVQLVAERVKKAESEAKYKTMFLSEMSHDIRTPMNAIVGYINLALLNSDDTVKIKHYLSKSLLAGNHLLSLINEVLDISRIESGKINITESECDLFELCKEIENILTVQTRARKQNFTIDTMKLKSSFVMCDKLHLSQILINILGNSVKYTQKGGEISLSIIENALPSYQNADASEYEFIIKDNGIGMSSDFLKHVFEPYARQSSVDTKIVGTGLGLAICKQLVEHMRGSIAIKSAEDIGTEITVKLRLSHIAKEQYEKQKFISNHDTNKIESQLKDTSHNYKGKTLLLVDDNDFNREISTEILNRAGFKVEEARNGQEAVDKVSSSIAGYYSAILMDIQMPVLNGYEATALIRSIENKALASIPIIAVSANAFDEDIQRAKLEGMDAYVVKPINITKLFDVLDGIFVKKNENLV